MLSLLLQNRKLTALISGLTLAAAAGVAVAAQPAATDETLTFDSGTQRVQMVELYTSQGCSSCPPADAWVNKLLKDPRLWKSIVPLAFHVDYWDYLGWRDEYASPVYSERQRRYRQQGGVRSVYTPGFLIDGQEWRGWFSRDPLPVEAKPAVALKASLDQQGLKASYAAPQPDQVLNIAILGFGIDTPIQGGENEGRSLRHDFVVLAYEQHPAADGMWEASLPPVRARGARRFALALWVSQPGSQKPLQATGGWLPQELIHKM
jgi:hypothetical protein